MWRGLASQTQHVSNERIILHIKSTLLLCSLFQGWYLVVQSRNLNIIITHSPPLLQN